MSLIIAYHQCIDTVIKNTSKKRTDDKMGGQSKSSSQRYDQSYSAVYQAPTCMYQLFLSSPSPPPHYVFMSRHVIFDHSTDTDSWTASVCASLMTSLARFLSWIWSFIRIIFVSYHFTHSFLMTLTDSVG
jgi:hypothetical protein